LHFENYIGESYGTALLCSFIFWIFQFALSLLGALRTPCPQILAALWIEHANFAHFVEMVEELSHTIFATGELEWKNISEYHQAAGHGEFAKNCSCT